MTSEAKLRAYLVDDEPLALKRLERLLAATGQVEVAGKSSDPEQALAWLSREAVDVLFLDIQMPGMNGFELLKKLPVQPMVVFTTAFDQYALKAFEVNSIDYLLKPIDGAQLERALGKLERLRSAAQAPAGARQDWMARPEFHAVLEQLASSLRPPVHEYLERIASRIGERIHFVEVVRVTHFFAHEKLTYAAADGRDHAVDFTIAELEQKLDPRKFVRIHRSTIVNTDWVQEVNTWFAGRVLLKLKDEKHTELTVARDRVRFLRERLGF